MASNHREIVNEAQRLLVAEGVTLGQLASTTEKSRQAASGWMSGKKKPDPDSRAKIADRWPGCATPLWDVIPITERQNSPSPPTVATDDGDPTATFVQKLKAHAATVELEIEQARSMGRVQDLVKLMTLKQKILMDGAKFTGELTAADESRLTRSARFIAIKTAISKALSPFPEAGKAVEEALRAINA
jgi:transcriptional regulator with XRE-family HTH domain